MDLTAPDRLEAIILNFNVMSHEEVRAIFDANEICHIRKYAAIH